ncbi:MAG: competence/damage-inducible protein A [Actinobacteria bacterium]|nr:competence/damage-inducible protein A [Actinomycetota bacterium]
MVGSGIRARLRAHRRGDDLRAEIVGIGTELLLGQIPNTNAQEISEALAAIGVDIHFHTVVGDNPERIVATISTALDRSDAVIITGGLGPTPDDITREAVAEVLGRPLRRDEALADSIRSVFAKLNRTMPEDNLRQADLPEGAEPIPIEGTAPGFFIDDPRGMVFALPGVPWEMRAMLDKTVLPKLREHGGGHTLVSREVIVMGLGESRTHEKIRDIVDRQSNPTIAYRAGGGVVRVRLTAKAPSEAAALGLIRPVEDAIRERLGVDALSGNFPSVAEALGDLLRGSDITVAAAESLTGGLIGSELTKVGGSGDFFKGSLVCYATEAKAEVADIDDAILSGPGAVSEEAAAALAQAAVDRFHADLGVAATGVAGPTEQEGKPVGTLYVAAHFEGATEVRFIQAYGDRDNIRALATNAALDLGRRMVLRAL